jgi:cyclase
MERLIFAIVISGCALLAHAAAASAEDKPVWDVKPIADHIYELTTDGGGFPIKVIASVGSDGLLIVDSGSKEASEALKAALASLGGPPRVIINTHAHIEHTAGNIALGHGALIIAHESVRDRLRRGSYLFDEFPDDALPKLTFTDSLTIYFNGEPIKLKAFPGAHDSGDIVIWFTASKVACVGALSNGLHFPSVDSEGGDVLKYPETSQRVIDFLPEDVKVIPGHGEDCTLQDCRKFHQMLVETTEVVRAGLAAGKDKATLQREDVLKPWSAFECAYVDKNAWIEYLADGLQRSGPKGPSGTPFFERMYYALRDKGVDGAVAEYFAMKSGGLNQTPIKETWLVYVPYKLDLNGRYPEALRLYDLCTTEYPAGKYTTFCLNRIGDINREMGNRDLAVAGYKRCLAVDPKDAHAKKALEELKSSKR